MIFPPEAAEISHTALDFDELAPSDTRTARRVGNCSAPARNRSSGLNEYGRYMTKRILEKTER